MDPVRSRSPSPEREELTHLTPLTEEGQLVQQAASEVFSTEREIHPSLDQDVTEVTLRALTFEEVMQLPPNVIRNLSEKQLENIPVHIAHIMGSTYSFINSFDGRFPSDLESKWSALAQNPFISQHKALSDGMYSVLQDIGWHNIQAKFNEMRKEREEMVAQMEAERQQNRAQRDEEHQQWMLEQEKRQQEADQVNQNLQGLLDRPQREKEHQQWMLEQEKRQQEADQVNQNLQGLLDSLGSINSTGSTNTIETSPQPTNPSVINPEIPPTPPRRQPEGRRSNIIIAIVIVSIATICICKAYANYNKGISGSLSGSDEL